MEDSVETKKVRGWLDNAKVMTSDIRKSGEVPSESMLDLMETLVEAQKEVFLLAVERPLALAAATPRAQVEDVSYKQTSLYFEAEGMPLRPSDVISAAQGACMLKMPEAMAVEIIEFIRKKVGGSKVPSFVLDNDTLLCWLEERLGYFNMCSIGDWMFRLEHESNTALRYDSCFPQFRARNVGKWIEAVPTAEWLKDTQQAEPDDHQRVSLYIDSAHNLLSLTNIEDTAKDSFNVTIPHEFADAIYESLRKFIESQEPQREHYVITTEQLIQFLRDYLMGMNTTLKDLVPDWLFLYEGEPWYQLKSARSNLPGEQLEVVSSANFLKAQISDGK